MAKNKKSSVDISIREARTWLRIDRNNLDDEVEQQSVLHEQLAEAAALARSQMDAAKARVDDVEAEIAVEIFNTAEKEDEKPPVVAQMKAMVQSDKGRKKAYAEYLDLKYLTEQWDQVRESFRTRRYMLQELAQMWRDGYYQEAGTRGTRQKMRETRAEKVSGKMAKKRKDREQE